jgi:hypothetical protein
MAQPLILPDNTIPAYNLSVDSVTEIMADDTQGLPVSGDAVSPAAARETLGLWYAPGVTGFGFPATSI